MIRAEQEESDDGRQRKVYAITELGRQRLHELLMDTEHHLAEYDHLFANKVTVFSELAPDERLYLCRHYAVYAQQNLDHITRKCRSVQDAAGSNLAPEQQKDILAVMAHRREYWEMERLWAEALMAITPPTEETA